MGVKSLAAEIASVAMVGAASGAAILQDGRWIWCVLGSMGGSVIAVAAAAEQLALRQVIGRIIVGLMLGAMLTPGMLMLAQAELPPELLMSASLAVAFAGWRVARFADSGLSKHLPWLFRCVLCWKWPSLAMCRESSASGTATADHGARSADPGSAQ